MHTSINVVKNKVINYDMINNKNTKIVIREHQTSISFFPFRFYRMSQSLLRNQNIFRPSY